MLVFTYTLGYILFFFVTYYSWFIGRIDLFTGLKENVKEVLTNLCQRHNVPSVKKLAYLNAIVKLISETDSQDYGYSPEDLFCW